MDLKDWGTNYLTVEYSHLTAWLSSILLFGVDGSFPTDCRAYEDLTNGSVSINGPQTPNTHGAK